MYKLIKSKIQNKFNIVDRQLDIAGQMSLSSFQFNSYLPYSSSSLRYSSISYLLNDVVINNRNNIIEFGGGISTIYFAKLAKINNISLKITTIDHDENWIQILKTILEKEEISDCVNILHSPMTHSELSLNNLEWYNEEIISNQIKDQEFDMVVIDGPIAYLKSFELSRYPALPFIQQYLAKRNSVFLDDTNRYGEKKIIKKWEKKFDRDFMKLNSSSMISFKGDYFNIK